MHDTVKCYKEIISAIEQRLKGQNIANSPKVIAVSKTFKLEKILPELKNLDFNTKEQIQIESIYFNYLSRQRADIDDFKKEEGLKIPKIIDYKKVGSLSNEIIEKLTKTKPPNLGAASRISGVTPAAIIAIMRYIKKNKNKKAAA